MKEQRQWGEGWGGTSPFLRRNIILHLLKKCSKVEQLTLDSRFDETEAWSAPNTRQTLIASEIT